MIGGWGRRHVGALVACSGGFAVLALLLVVLGLPHVALLAWGLSLTTLAAVVPACHREYVAAQEAAVAALVRALAMQDPYTGEHTERVARYSVYIGEELGLSKRRLERLRHAALLHDVGKLAVPVELLNKPGPLTNDEYAQVKQHESVGTEMLEMVDVLRRLAAGSLDAAVVAVADAYDAMTSTRAYRRALRQEVAFDELRARAGTQFDVRCVDALIRGVQRRGERHGLGFERTNVVYAVDPPVVGVLR